MSKATETKLSALHGALAEVLHRQVTAVEEETVYDENGVETKTGQLVYTASPATLAIAAKFLKDNDITVDVEVSTNMSGIREELSKKQRQSRLMSAQGAAHEFH